MASVGFLGCSNCQLCLSLSTQMNDNDLRRGTNGLGSHGSSTAYAHSGGHAVDSC